MLATGSYIAPELKAEPSLPPQISIAEPVQTAEWRTRAVGAPVIDVEVHVSDTGS